MGSTDCPITVIAPKRIGDQRGWFSETYHRARYAELGVDVAFCQDNRSRSRQAGVLRGLHFQRPPHAQAKLVQCTRGRILDVVVDVRLGSASFGRWASAELSADNGLQVFVPIGFAHGFLTLEGEVEVDYKVSDYYAPECEDGLVWDDPEVAVEWPLRGTSPILSEKDRALPRLAEMISPFTFGPEPARAPQPERT